MEAAATLIGAGGQSKAMNAEARLGERQARDVDLQAAQAAAQRRDQLLSAMSTIETRRAASGLSGDSPTAIAIENEMRKRVSQNISIDNRGFANQKYALLQGAAVNRAGAKNSLIVGALTAGHSLLNSGASAAAAASGGSGGKNSRG